MEEKKEQHKKSIRFFKSFPDPRKGDYLIAPLGSGVYQLRNRKNNKYVLFGTGKHLAHRMTSLLPKPFGAGTRNNEDKRRYILNNLQDIEYRTISFIESNDAKRFESYIKSVEQYLFNT